VCPQDVVNEYMQLIAPRLHRLVKSLLVELAPLFNKMLFQMASVAYSATVNLLLGEHVAAAPHTAKST